MLYSGGKKNLVLHQGQSQRSWAGIYQRALVGAETWPGTASAWSLSSFCSQPVVNRALLPVQPHHAHFSASMSLTSREKPVQVLAASRLCSQRVSGQKASLPALHLAKPRPLLSHSPGRLPRGHVLRISTSGTSLGPSLHVFAFLTVLGIPHG